MQIGRVGIGSAIAGGVLGVAAMVGVGVGVNQLTASAQTPSATPSATAKADRQAEHKAMVETYLAKLAANLGVTVDALKAANITTMNQMIDEAVASGKMTAEQGAQAKARVAETGGMPFGGPSFGGPKGGHGPGGHGGPGPRAEGMRGGPGELMGSVAAAIGIDQQTLMQELRSGKTLAQVAEAHGKSREDVKAALGDKFGPMLDRMLDTALPRGPHGAPAPSTTPGT